MEQRRILSFAVLSMAVIIAWNMFVVQPMLPEENAEQPPGGEQVADVDDPAEREVEDGDDPQDPKEGEDDPDQPGHDPEVVGVEPADPGEEPADDPEEPAKPVKVEHPPRVVKLGSLDPETGYFFEARLNSRGAAVESISLNDPRYRELNERDAALKIVGTPPKADEIQASLRRARGIAGVTDVQVVAKPSDEPQPKTIDYEMASGIHVVVTFDHELKAAEKTRVTERLDAVLGKLPRTFELDSPELDEDFEEAAGKNALAEKLNWKTETKADANGVVEEVTFSLESADGNVVVRKRYWLEKGDGKSDSPRNSDPGGYTLRMQLTFENVGEKAASLSYVLQGPTGIPLEDTYRKTRDVKAAFHQDGAITTATLSAKDVVSEIEDEELTEWTYPPDYIGVDVQYFAAIVMPDGDPAEGGYLDHSEPVLVAKHGEDKMADVSVALVSRPVDLEPGESVTHQYDLFAGPKKRAILEKIGADTVLDYGWFPFGPTITRFISDSLLSVLQMLHAIGLPYGLAIVGLTVIVRGAMFPISLKQNRNMSKMRELQPKMKEIQQKYANDREKMGQAMMALYREHGYNPVAGCLPMFLQLPIFIGLYQAIGNAVDLRLAPFLWADNLAAPDALFDLPFTMPFFGWTTFNLLPVITIGLFVVQQKMFMPPPTDEQQAAQMKMMNFMMIFMGVLFYNVPAGLCVYFISSSLWGIAERQLLGGVTPPKPSETGETGESTTVVTSAKRKDEKSDAKKDEPEKESFLGRLLRQADSAGSQTAASNGSNRSRKDKGGRNKGKRKSRR